MSLQCKKYGSRNTQIVEANKLAEVTKDTSILSAASGTLSGDAIVEVLNNLFKVIGKIFGFMEEKEKNQRNVILCKDYGYWEKV